MIGLSGATVRFGTREVLRDLTFSVPRGQTLAILGPNGRGKTTALRSVLGFQKLKQGTRHSPPVVGYLPQSSAAVHAYKALDVVVMGRAAKIGLFGQPTSADVETARAAMEQVGVSACAESLFDQLSGGERQLVLLARALATGSDALVLDEPCSALDLKNQERVLELINGLRQTRSKAMLFTTHDPNHALAAADAALMLIPDGEVILGPVVDVLNQDNLARLYGVAMRVVEFTGPDGAPRRAIVPAFAGLGRAA